MKQGGIRMMSDTGEEDARSRRLRWFRWVLIVLLVVGLGFLARRMGWVATPNGGLADHRQPAGYDHRMDKMVGPPPSASLASRWHFV